MVVRMFLRFLNLRPDWQFCKSYSLCMGCSLCKMADFQNRLISRILGVFSSGYLHRTTLMFLQNGCSHVFEIFKFAPGLAILQGLQPLHGLQPLQDNRFSKSSYFSNIWFFCERFFAQINFNVFVEWFFACFWHF